MMRCSLGELLYKMQICGYDRRKYWDLVFKTTQGVAQPTARLRRLRMVSIFLVVLGLGLPLLCLAHIVACANWMLTPYEKNVQRYFLRRAQKILDKRPDLIKIGITGSYGKTSVKNILAQLLSVKYRVVASPASFNTPMGLARTVNEHLQSDTQVLIMEMGARRPGEILELAQILKPHYAIITSIGACHLETFGDIQTVARTKSEILTQMSDGGMVVTDGDNPWCQKLIYTNIRKVKAVDVVEIPTNLLGAHQQKNLQLAAVIARELGISDEQISQTALNLHPTPHRLEKIVAPNGIIIFDDSYNANPVSAKSALDVIAKYQTRKVVQTPGFVEQGKNAETAHIQFCEQIKTVANAVIVVGELNRKYFEQGLANWQGDVIYVPNRDSAKKIYPQWLSKGDILLIINDLPEQY